MANSEADYCQTSRSLKSAIGYRMLPNARFRVAKCWQDGDNGSLGIRRIPIANTEKSNSKVPERGNPSILAEITR